MPSLITHYEFSKQNFPKHKKIFYLGSQGPDPFFYYGYTSPLRSNIREVREFGTYLHEIDPFITFSFLFDYAKKEEDKEKEEILIAFIKGLMSHYVLDRTCHPYIFYKTGFPLKGTIFSIYHSLLETDIDVLMEENFNDKPSFKEMLKVDKKDLKLVSKMMKALADYLNKDRVDEKSYYHSVKTMLTVNRCINSKIFGFRKFILSHLMKNSVINAMSHPKLKNLDKNIDYLNLNENEWFNVVTNESMGKDSFFDLIDKAYIDLAHVLQTIDDVYYNDLDYEPINEFIGQINHDGIKVGQKMKYYSIIFKK